MEHYVHFKASVPNTWAAIKAQQALKTKKREVDSGEIVDEASVLPEQICECGREKAYKDRACARCKRMESIRASVSNDWIAKQVLLSIADDGPSTVTELQARDLGDAKTLTSILKKLAKAGTLIARRRGRWWEYMLPEDAP